MTPYAAILAGIKQPDLLKGPLLETTPEFAKGCSIKDLVTQGVLMMALQIWLEMGYLSDRNLYMHQNKPFVNYVRKSQWLDNV
jgi:hypothetical protein